MDISANPSEMNGMQLLETMVVCHQELLQQRLGKETAVITGASRGGTSMVAYAMIKLGYPLLEDPSLRVSRAYGVLDERAGMALRGTFIIDDEGVVRAYSVYPAGTGRNIDEIVRLLQALQTGKSCPASWRPGRKTL